MEIQPGDVLEMKKEHPCGSRQWEVLRVGWTSACAVPAVAGKSCSPGERQRKR